MTNLSKVYEYNKSVDYGYYSVDNIESIKNELKRGSLFADT